MNNDENEIIKIGCDSCKIFKEGTYKELFGNLPSLKFLPKFMCSECGGDISLEMTGRYRVKINGPARAFEHQMAFPQYSCRYGENTVITSKTWLELQEYIRKYKYGTNYPIDPKVWKHWENILKGIVPFGMKIVG